MQNPQDGNELEALKEQKEGCSSQSEEIRGKIELE